MFTHTLLKAVMNSKKNPFLLPLSPLIFLIKKMGRKPTYTEKRVLVTTRPSILEMLEFCYPNLTTNSKRLQAIIFDKYATVLKKNKNGTRGIK